MLAPTGGESGRVRLVGITPGTQAENHDLAAAVGAVLAKLRVGDAEQQDVAALPYLECVELLKTKVRPLAFVFEVECGSPSAAAHLPPPICEVSVAAATAAPVAAAPKVKAKVKVKASGVRTKKPAAAAGAGSGGDAAAAPKVKAKVKVSVKPKVKVKVAAAAPAAAAPEPEPEPEVDPKVVQLMEMGFGPQAAVESSLRRHHGRVEFAAADLLEGAGAAEVAGFIVRADPPALADQANAVPGLGPPPLGQGPMPDEEIDRPDQQHTPVAQALIQLFLSRCGSTDEETASMQLELHGWELEAAVRSHRAEVKRQRELEERLQRERERKEEEARKKRDAIEAQDVLAREAAEAEERRAADVKATAQQQLGSVPSVCISGSLKDGDNGVYFQRADHEGMPRYEEEGGGGRHVYYHMPSSRWCINGVFTPDTNTCFAYIHSASGALPNGAQTWQCWVNDSCADGALTVELLDAAAAAQGRQEALIRQFVSRCGSADTQTSAGKRPDETFSEFFKRQAKEAGGGAVSTRQLK